MQNFCIKAYKSCEQCQSDLCLITPDDGNTDVQKFAQYFTVEDMRRTSDKDSCATKISDDICTPIHYGVDCDDCQLENIKGHR